MRTLVTILALACIILISGCSSADAPGETSSTPVTTTSTTISMTETATGTPVATSETIATTTASVTDAPAVTATTTDSAGEETAATTTAAETTTPPGPSADVTAYLGSIMPVIERHTISKTDMTDANQAFAAEAPGMEAAGAYAETLKPIKAAMDSQYNDALAITPPPGGDDFHALLLSGISTHRDAAASHIVYYTEVAANGTADFALFEAGANGLAEADNIWWDQVLPGLETLLGS